MDGHAKEFDGLLPKLWKAFTRQNEVRVELGSSRTMYPYRGTLGNLGLHARPSQPLLNHAEKVLASCFTVCNKTCVVGILEETDTVREIGEGVP